VPPNESRALSTDRSLARAARCQPFFESGDRVLRSGVRSRARRGGGPDGAGFGRLPGSSANAAGASPPGSLPWTISSPNVGDLSSPRLPSRPRRRTRRRFGRQPCRFGCQTLGLELSFSTACSSSGITRLRTFFSGRRQWTDEARPSWRWWPRTKAFSFSSQLSALDVLGLRTLSRTEAAPGQGVLANVTCVHGYENGDREGLVVHHRGKKKSSGKRANTQGRHTQGRRSTPFGWPAGRRQIARPGRRHILPCFSLHRVGSIISGCDFRGRRRPFWTMIRWALGEPQAAPKRNSALLVNDSHSTPISSWSSAVASPAWRRTSVVGARSGGRVTLPRPAAAGMRSGDGDSERFSDRAHADNFITAVPLGPPLAAYRIL